MNRWFRMYDEALDDPKVQQLDPRLFRHWFNALCLANRHRGVLPDLKSCAFAFRRAEEEITQIFGLLVDAGLLDRNRDGTYSPHNWSGRQYLSDNSTERVRKFRDKQRKAGKGSTKQKDETFRATVPETVSETQSETPKETDQTTETDTETDQNRTPPASRARSLSLPKIRRPEPLETLTDDPPGKPELTRVSLADEAAAERRANGHDKPKPIEPVKPNIAGPDDIRWFEQFWSKYPRKVGKKAALKAWVKAIKVTDFTTIMEGLDRYIEHGIKADEPEYTKHPSTWLNGECWNDEYPNAASVPRKGAHGRLLDNLAEIVAGEDARGARPAHPPALVDQRGARSRH
jgi:hypothetical protein